MIEITHPSGVGPARFETRADVLSDLVVVAEVWRDDEYRIEPEAFAGARVLDLGANVGAFTVLAALAGAERVVAVEPESSNYARLLDHLALNDVVDRVVPLRVAAGGMSGGLAEVFGHGAQASLIGSGEGQVVDLVPVAALMAEHGPFDVVKIDVEGAEWSVLAALVGIGMPMRRMVVEFHGPGMHGDPVSLVEAVNEARAHGPLVFALAEHGSIEVVGRPSVGGMIRWRSYT